MKLLKSFLVPALVWASLLCVASTATAQQYLKHAEQTAGGNVPLEQFASQKKTLFNFDWRFALGNISGAERPEFDDSDWRKLDLPHDFQWEQPWSEDAGGARGFKPMCDGWYRKTFQADSAWMGREVLLDFGGVMYVSDVYINGQKVRSHEYGYVGYEVEISKHLRYDAPNVVAVYASTGPKNGSRWYTGGGIFRDVYLKLQNPTHIYRHGIYVHTPRITDAKADVEVVVDVQGFRHRNVVVRATIMDANAQALSTVEAKMDTLTKHQHDEICLPLVTLDAPHRWDIDDPYLYQVRVDVEADGVLVDSEVEHFGVRTIEYSTNFGFKLNGRKVFLQGIANHHDMGALGAASYDVAIEREMRMLKSFGFNAIRCSHNPYSESFTRIADRVGLLIVDELIDKWSDGEYWGGRKPFMSIWPELIQEWVTRDRNCPSVIMWSLGNELQTRENWSGYKTNDWGITTYRIFDQMLKRYDRTRPTTVAQFPARAGAIREEKEFKTYLVPPELACETEIASFNYQWDAYPSYFKHKPDLILFQSEAVTNQLQAPFYGMDRKRTVGLAYWGAVEYWGESNKWPKKGWNYSFFSHTLAAYPQAYLIKGSFMPEQPTLRIGIMKGGESVDWNDVKVGQKTYVSHWNFKQGTKQQVATFTNTEEVELLVNGVSLGRQRNDTTDVFKRNIITWQDVPYDKGGMLTAIGYNGGKEVVRHQIETAGEAVRLRITAENEGVVPADGMSLQYYWIEAVDKQGRVVPGYGELLTATVEGEAKLFALDNGDHFTDELFLPTITSKKMLDGRIQVIVRPTRTAGAFTLRVNAGKLKPATLKLKTKTL